jgi:hypothetical protein
VVALLSLGIGVPARAGNNLEQKQTPFDRGQFTLMLGAGRQTVFGQPYVGVGIGGGYFVLDGLEVGLFAVHEFGGPPSINALSPSVRYVAQPLAHWPVVPYVGAFYKHWFVGDPYADVDIVGPSAGLLHVQGRLIFGLGVVYERVISECVADCDSVYPDVTLAFRF